MLSQEVMDHNAQNRRSQKTQISLQDIITKIDKQNYQDLISWLLEACEDLKVRPTTRYLSRAYFDEVLIFCKDIKVSEYQGLAIGCLSLAIKFNELREISQLLTAQYLLKHYEIQLSGQQYFSLQVKLYWALQMRFKLTTPYDYFPIFFSRFPWLFQTQQAIVDILYLTVALPSACSYSAEELFFASVWAIFQFKKVKLNELQGKVLNSMTDCLAKAKTLTPKILDVVQTFFEPQEQN